MRGARVPEVYSGTAWESTEQNRALPRPVEPVQASAAPPGTECCSPSADSRKLFRRNDELPEGEPDRLVVLAALMRRGTWSRAEQKIECLRRVAAADLPGRSRLVLGNWIETYIQLDEWDAAEYDRLRSLAGNEEVKTMELTWAERMELQGVEKGLEKGLEQGLTTGLQALRQVVVRLLGRRFGPGVRAAEGRGDRLDGIPRQPCREGFGGRVDRGDGAELSASTGTSRPSHRR